MNAERDLSVLPHLIAHEATRLLGADRASIFLLDVEQGEFVSQVALDSDPIRFDARLGVAGAVAESGELINVGDAQEHARFYTRVDAEGRYETRSLLAVPLLNAEAVVIGVFEVLNKISGSFTSEDEEILTALAPHAAIAIETAQLVEHLRLEREALAEENTQLRREVRKRFATQNIIGASEAVRNNIQLIDQIGASPINVLVTGESGTGKELVARAIHYAVPSEKCPFIALNCAALPETLVEAELFGIEKGVATGVDRRAGKFEEAHGGTLFLDEIGDLAPSAQAKILRVLQEKVVSRVGGQKMIPVDVRVIAATHRDLERAIEKKEFREDLYYRLKVIHIKTPSLRDVPEDIPLLAQHFLDRVCKEAGVPTKSFASDAVQRLMEHRWPGNIRELENEIRRLVVLVRRREVRAEDLSDAIGKASGGALPSGSGLKEQVDALERRLIKEALEVCAGNQSQAAQRLGVSRQGLIKKLKRFELAPSPAASEAAPPSS
jgi:Nif-specific regulatory protein